MEKILEGAIGQAPSLVVLVVVVVVFLKHLRDRDKEFSAVVREIAEREHDARKQSREVIAHCTNIIERSAVVMGQCVEALNRGR